MCVQFGILGSKMNNDTEIFLYRTFFNFVSPI